MSIPIGHEFVMPQEGNLCFGCGHANERGVQLRFKRVEPSVVESRVVVPKHLCGPAGIVHGGIQRGVARRGHGRCRVLCGGNVRRHGRVGAAIQGTGSDRPDVDRPRCVHGPR